MGEVIEIPEENFEEIPDPWFDEATETSILSETKPSEILPEEEMQNLEKFLRNNEQTETAENSEFSEVLFSHQEEKNLLKSFANENLSNNQTIKEFLVDIEEKEQWSEFHKYFEENFLSQIQRENPNFSKDRFKINSLILKGIKDGYNPLHFFPRLTQNELNIYLQTLKKVIETWIEMNEVEVQIDFLSDEEFEQMFPTKIEENDDDSTNLKTLSKFEAGKSFFKEKLQKFVLPISLAFLATVPGVFGFSATYKYLQNQTQESLEKTQIQKNIYKKATKIQVLSQSFAEYRQLFEKDYPIIKNYLNQLNTIENFLKDSQVSSQNKQIILGLLEKKPIIISQEISQEKYNIFRKQNSLNLLKQERSETNLHLDKSKLKEFKKISFVEEGNMVEIYDNPTTGEYTILVENQGNFQQLDLDQIAIKEVLEIISKLDFKTKNTFPFW